MKQETINRIAFFSLTVFFFAEAFFLSGHIETVLDAPVLFWIAIAPATLRLAHTLTFNDIAEWLRHPFCKVVQDTAGGSESIEAKEGRFEVIGKLLSCPICSGTWSAVFLLTVYSFLPRYGMILVLILGVAGVSEILHNLVCLLEWAGRDHREQAGTAWLLKNRGNYVGEFMPKAKTEPEKAFSRQ